MNRAILIVICDFLVSAMLSMMTGMVPAHTGGTGVGLDEETTRAMLAELESTRASLERMRERLREAVRRAGGATPEQERKLRELALRIVASQRNAELIRNSADKDKLAHLSAAELQKRLEAEVRRRMSAELELKGQQADRKETEKELRQMRKDVIEAGRAMAEIAKRDSETRRELSSSREELRRTEKELADTKAALGSADAELKRRQDEVRRKAADLAEVRETLREMNARLGRSNVEAGSLRQTLAYTAGKLDSAERKAADTADQLERMRREQSVTILERDEARRKQAELAQLVKKTVGELSEARRTAEESRVKSAEATGKLAVVTEKLKETERKLGNHVLKCYGNGAVKLEVAVREAGLMSERRGGGTYYLPLVEMGGKTFVVGQMQQFAGDLKHPLSFNKVTQVSMFLSAPGVESAQGMPVTGPVLLARRDPRMAAVEASVSGRTPLKMLTLEELRSRGVHDLYLFKSGTFGKESARIDGRCTLDVSDNVPYVFIRAGSRSELKAEPGDLLLTREGDYVGIVVASASRGFGRGEEARAFVFPDRDAWKGARQIPLGKPRDARYCDAFASAVRAAKAAVKP